MERRLTLFKEIITGTMKGKTVNGITGQPQYMVSSYNQRMVLNIGDYIVLYGRPPHQRHMYCGTIVAFQGNRFQLADEQGIPCFNCCADGAVCIVKY